MSQNINVKLDHWKKSLLDLSKRNRLINCPLPKENQRVQRHTLLLKNPNALGLWEMLAEKKQKLVFPIPPIESETDSENELKEILDFSTIPTATVLTNQSEKETYKTLRSLKSKSREFNLEKGINALHLAFGFLNWKDNGMEGQDVRSPLLLLPVQLLQEDISSPFELSTSDEEIVTNRSLAEKLYGEFGIELPSFSEGMDLEEYLAAVENIIGMGWTVSNDVSQLSLFFIYENQYVSRFRIEC